MAATIKEGNLLWEPPEDAIKQSAMVRYMNWLKENRGYQFSSYDELWQWSVTHLEDFWSSIWYFFDVKASVPYTTVLEDADMPGAKWFKGAKLNYAEHIFRHINKEKTAVIHASESRADGALTWKDLYEQTASIAEGLKQLGVKPGDRVVSYAPNIPETLIAFLACASIGAVWSSCSPDFGDLSVIDRFNQVEPKVMFTVDGYKYGGKSYNRLKTVANIQKAIPTLNHTIVIPCLNDHPDLNISGLKNVIKWEKVVHQHRNAPLSFEQVAFDHPLWILYSSGTTGIPKAIVQSQGGILLEHLKSIALQMDLNQDDRFFWFTTTGWMMWNVLVSGLLAGATVLLYDGNPGYPDMNTLWKFAEKTGMTYFGTSASYLSSCAKAGVEPGRIFDLRSLKAVGTTGSPLTVNGFQWVYEHVKKDLWLASVSGGTDLCTAFVGGSPLLPVHAGEIQCRTLGAAVEAFDDNGRPLIDAVGELVITKPMPSMPIYFWNDPDNKRYRDSYFDMYPGIWRHGDFIKITSRGSCIIYGRSDATINRGGIRMGTSEIYHAVEGVEEVADSLVVDVQNADGESFMPLFIVVRENVQLDESLKNKIKHRIRENCSPRHVPNDIFAVADIPKTLNGKKLEVPVKKILMGTPLEKAVNQGSLSNPDSLEFFVDLAERLNGR
ncbi:acetoacetyl-CoA synthetase [Scopulibacillus daqui]|uniref:Acetoacetyl-CoA synthetase n=1 Tax=Scopulibacillus daqui TaxID=1469162 RepID=A0ABS2PWK9_9BACL|nr:acetoacetate--CoA ligase [Scopulibacillus daqui]MBM7644433.1 acetoacetyl-CoA synthetase [Scopulibacillus daqui]